jgi:hypothetical protein
MARFKSFKLMLKWRSCTVTKSAMVACGKTGRQQGGRGDGSWKKRKN